MLEKNPGGFRTDKLRTIRLYEIDFNMGNKMLGRQMLGKAEEKKLFQLSTQEAGKTIMRS